MSIRHNGKIIAGATQYHPDLFDWKWADHQLDDVQWLRADTFSWQPGGVYEAAYQHLVDDIPAEVIAITVLVLSTPIVYERYTDGDVSGARHPYCWQIMSGTGKLYTDSETPSVGDFTYTTAQATQKDLSINSIVLPSPETETIAGVTVSFYRAADGHKICLADQESNVAAIYTVTGVAWYYIVDTVNQRFKLPRTKFGFTGLRDNVGNYIAPGLPNIIAYANSSANQFVGTSTTGAFSGTTHSSSNWSTGTASTWQGNFGNGLDFNASLSNSIYGASTTVQPPATEMYLYFYVGNFTQTAIENTAGITTEEMNDKLDMDLGNASSVTKQEIAALCFPDFTSPTRTGLSLNTSYQAESNGYVKISASTGGDIYSLTRVSIQVSNDNSTFSVVAANAAYSTGGQHVLIAPVRRGQYFKGTGSSGSMEFFSI